MSAAARCLAATKGDTRKPPGRADQGRSQTPHGGLSHPPAPATRGHAVMGDTWDCHGWGRHPAGGVWVMQIPGNTRDGQHSKQCRVGSRYRRCWQVRGSCPRPSPQWTPNRDAILVKNTELQMPARHGMDDLVNTPTRAHDRRAPHSSSVLMGPPGPQKAGRQKSHHDGQMGERRPSRRGRGCGSPGPPRLWGFSAGLKAASNSLLTQKVVPPGVGPAPPRPAPRLTRGAGTGRPRGRFIGSAHLRGPREGES